MAMPKTASRNKRRTPNDAISKQTMAAFPPLQPHKHNQSSLVSIPVSSRLRYSSLSVPVRRIRSSSSSSLLTNTPNSFTPITKHYALNKTLYQAFHKLCEKKHYKTALSVGIQFCRVALWDIPQHSYYNSISQKYRDLKIESAGCALSVSKLLPGVLEKVKRCVDRNDRNKQCQTDEALKERCEKDEEIRMLKLAARDHYHAVASEEKIELTSEDLTSSPTHSSGSDRKNVKDEVVKKEILQVDEEFPSWLRALESLECGSDTLVKLCPTSLARPLDSVEEDSLVSSMNNLRVDDSRNDDDDNDDGSTGAVYVKNRIKKVDTKEQHQDNKSQSSKSEAHRRKNRNHKTRKKSKDRFNISQPVDFTRTTSAPAYLGPPSQTQLECSTRRNHGSQNQSAKEAAQMQQRDPAEEREQQLLDSAVAPICTQNKILPKLNSSHNKGDNVESNKSKEDLQFQADLERALYFSGIEIQNVSRETSHSDQLNIIDIEVLSPLYRSDFEEFQKNQMISVEFLDTYQGRIPESTNGCVVIAPLICLHHLCDVNTISERNEILSEGLNPSSCYNSSGRTFSSASSTEGATSITEKGGIGNDTVKIVIDIQAPLVLPEVREKLGLQQGALIVPSDVHNYLIEQNFLKQAQFAGVCGGNILNDEHMSQFIDTLEKFGRSRRVAATFFFHEHVVALNRITRTTSTSFGKKRTNKKVPFLKRMKFRKNNEKHDPTLDNITIKEEEVWYELIDSLPGAMMLSRSDGKEIEEEACYTIPSTARIRCNSIASLKSCLRWYACSKFTEDDSKFINHHQWNDLNAHFDPRVFQAFVWSN